MAINLAIDDDLLKNVLGIGGAKAKKAVVNFGLNDFVQRRNRQEVIDLFGEIEFDKDYDYKKARKKR
jgi:Arc/MetJ family transcription regulator